MSDNYRLNYRGLIEYTDYMKRYIQNELPVEMRGATRFNDGESGLVPKPVVGDNSRYLRGDGTWSSVPSFITLYDVNKDVIKVGTEEKEISLINCQLSKKVDLEGHFTVSFFATEECNITIRIKDDGVTEIFTPQVYETVKGYNSFGIPHAYLAKDAGLHHFTVTMQCSNGEVTIPTREIFYTIYGSIDDAYVNAGIDIIDIAIKNTEAGSAPSEIWSLGFEEGHLLLRQNEYNNPNGNKWNDIYDFGLCSGGCLEFYGQWIIDNLDNKFYLVTEEFPHVFIIDSNHNLIEYKDGNYDRGTQLANNVSGVSACTGYRSGIDNSLDQGLIVSFIKNGKAYYRQWKYYNEESNMWYADEELETSDTAISVSVHRLPDYRVGFLVKTVKENKWFITDRTFIGNTAKNEYVDALSKIRSVVSIIGYDRLDEATGIAKINEFPNTRAYHNGFIMEFEGTLRFIYGAIFEDFEKTLHAYRNGTEVEVGSIEIENNKLIVYTKNDVKGDSDFTISWNFEDLLSEIYNKSIVTIQSSYTWHLPTLVITSDQFDSAAPEVDSVATIEMHQIKDINNKNKEIVEPIIDAQVSIDIGQIMDTNKTYLDLDNEVSTDVEATIEVIQVSDVPI